MYKGRLLFAWARRRASLLRRIWQHARLEQTNFSSGLGDSAWLLYGLVRSMKPQVCVEIGSARGRSASFIGMALRENNCGKLFAIDPHQATDWNDSRSVDTLPILSANLARFGVQPYVEIMRQTSEEAARIWSRPIDMLFIDGDHSYEGVRRDWELFTPFVQPFGVVVFHDTIWGIDPPGAPRPDMGVPRFVDELRAQHFPVLTINRDFGVSVVQPTGGGVALQKP